MMTQKKKDNDRKCVWVQKARVPEMLALYRKPDVVFLAEKSCAMRRRFDLLLSHRDKWTAAHTYPSQRDCCYVKIFFHLLILPQM